VGGTAAAWYRFAPNVGATVSGALERAKLLEQELKKSPNAICELRSPTDSLSSDEGTERSVGCRIRG
jgi:hypothetical protein